MAESLRKRGGIKEECDKMRGEGGRSKKRR